jgi:PII-like signaling protein
VQQAQPASLLRIHISESDRYQGKPLYEAIVGKCREMKIAGATVVRGVEGYGETEEMHKAHIVHHDRPILITIVDAAEHLAPLIPVVEDGGDDRDGIDRRLRGPGDPRSEAGGPAG